MYLLITVLIIVIIIIIFGKNVSFQHEKFEEKINKVDDITEEQINIFSRYPYIDYEDVKPLRRFDTLLYS